MSFEPTSFLESNALLALTADRDDEAERIISKMTDFEIVGLRDAARSLVDLCDYELYERMAEEGR